MPAAALSSAESTAPGDGRPGDGRPADGRPQGVQRPLGGYAALLGTFFAAVAGFSAWFRASGRELPEAVSARDLALLTVASHKTARALSRDRVTAVVRAPFTSYQGEGGPGEVEEAPRGHGLRRAIGELLVCPYCLGMWVSAGYVAALLVAPRLTRWVATAMVVFSGSETLQLAYVRAERLADG